MFFKFVVFWYIFFFILEKVVFIFFWYFFDFGTCFSVCYMEMINDIYKRIIIGIGDILVNKNKVFDFINFVIYGRER